MKRITTTLLFSLSIFLASGGSDLNRVDATEFSKIGEATQIIGSASQYGLAGVKDGRAFIKHWTAITVTGDSRTVHYWIPLAELPPDIASALVAGRNPWRKSNPASK